MPEQTNKSFIQEWGVLIGFGVLVMATFVGFRAWTERKANDPVATEYAWYLREVASNAKSSAAYLDAYYARFSRTTVASKHFEPVCSAVTTLAAKEGFNAEKVSAHMARGCRLFIEREVKDLAP